MYLLVHLFQHYYHIILNLQVLNSHQLYIKNYQKSLFHLILFYSYFYINIVTFYILTLSFYLNHNSYYYLFKVKISLFKFLKHKNQHKKVQIENQE